MRKLTYSFVCAALAVAGCGSDSSGVDSFIESIAKQQCAWEYRCCTDAEIKKQEGNRYMSQDACEPYHELSLQTELYANRLAVKQGHLKIDKKQADACLAQMGAVACNPKPGAPPQMPSMAMDACVDVFVGATKAGQRCELPIECEKGTHCAMALGASAGVCVPYQKENEICNTSKDCDPSVDQLYCALQDFKCHKRSLEGQPCAYTISETTSKETLPLLAECDTTNDNLYCDPASKTCKHLPAAGEPCLTTLPPGVSASCDPDPDLRLRCVTPTGGAGGTCTAPAKENQDCTNVNCDVDLYCDTSAPPSRVCHHLPGLNESCATTGACVSPYYCDFTGGNLCHRRAQLGERCDTSTICDIGLFCDSSLDPAVCQPSGTVTVLCSGR
jgi:hypothetical protein